VSGNDPHAEAENVELTKLDIDKIYYTGSSIDLKIGLREAILLSLPIAPLCKEDCAGLCAKCGANKNIVSCDCVCDGPGLFTPPMSDKKPAKKRKKNRERKCAK
jgi:uncharacterized protein